MIVSHAAPGRNYRLDAAENSGEDCEQSCNDSIQTPHRVALRPHAKGATAKLLAVGKPQWEEPNGRALHETYRRTCNTLAP